MCSSCRSAYALQGCLHNFASCALRNDISEIEATWGVVASASRNIPRSLNDQVGVGCGPAISGWEAERRLSLTGHSLEPTSSDSIDEASQFRPKLCFAEAIEIVEPHKRCVFLDIRAKDREPSAQQLGKDQHDNCCERNCEHLD